MSRPARVTLSAGLLIASSMLLVWTLNRPGNSTPALQGVLIGLLILATLVLAVFGWFPLRASVLLHRVGKLAEGELVAVSASDSTWRALDTNIERSVFFPRLGVMELETNSIVFWTGTRHPRMIGAVEYVNVQECDADPVRRQLIIRLRRVSRPNELKLTPFNWYGPIPGRYPKSKFAQMAEDLQGHVLG